MSRTYSELIDKNREIGKAIHAQINDPDQNQTNLSNPDFISLGHQDFVAPDIALTDGRFATKRS